MRKLLSRDLGFEYTDALCCAIEKYTQRAEDDSPYAFHYRGAYLKYAVERALYFSLVNNERLYNLFTRGRTGELSESIELPTEVERDLAISLFETGLVPIRLKVGRRYRFIARSFLGQVRNWGRAVRSLLMELSQVSSLQSHSGSHLKQSRPSILIYVIHEKFVRYLRPVTDCLVVPYCYLLTPDLKHRGYLEREGLPYIECANVSASLYAGQLRGALSHFRYLANWYDRIYGSLASIQPQCVVLVEGNSPQDETVNQACTQLSIPVVCIQQGWSPIVHNGFRNMSYTKMLVWGEGFNDLLQPYNPNQKFIVTGSHIIDSVALPAHKNQLSRKGICFFLQGISRLINQAHWEEFLKLAMWAATEFTEVPILVREHPSCPLSVRERSELSRAPHIILTPPNIYSVVDVLHASCLSVSIYSSTILESIAAGVPPLIFNMTSLPAYFPDVQASGAGVEVKSLEAAKQVIRRAIMDESYTRQFELGIRQFQKTFFYQDSQKAVDRIVGEIISVCRTHSGQ